MAKETLKGFQSSSGCADSDNRNSAPFVAYRFGRLLVMRSLSTRAQFLFFSLVFRGRFDPAQQRLFVKAPVLAQLERWDLSAPSQPAHRLDMRIEQGRRLLRIQGFRLLGVGHWSLRHG